MSLKSLIATGTKVWLDSIDPPLVKKNRAAGATGATSNPIIVADIIKAGAFNDNIAEAVGKGEPDEQIAWGLTDHLVKEAQAAFLPVWEETTGNNGYVSFELDPLLEDKAKPTPTDVGSKKYIELGKKWAAGHKNRMIKVPATAAGLGALEELAAAGITLNVTLIFSMRQYKLARDAVWKGAQRRKDGPKDLKSVYSIFVSRVDVYTEKHVPELSPEAQGQVGIVNAKRLWQENQRFWSGQGPAAAAGDDFRQHGDEEEGRSDPKDKYVARLWPAATFRRIPPATNDAVEKLNHDYTRQVDKMPPKPVLDDIDAKVDQAEDGEHADGRGNVEVRRPAEGAAEADRRQAGRGQPGQGGGHVPVGGAAGEAGTGVARDRRSR